MNNRVGFREIARLIIVVLLQIVILFIAAGRWDWIMGWVYVILFVSLTAAGRLLLFHKFPDLFIERAKSLDMQDAKSWDKILVPIIAIYCPLAVIIVAGLDQRFSWSQYIPLAIQITAVVFALSGILFSIWATLENRFFSGVVRIQKDRGHSVVSTGPYKFIRHPGYTGGIVADIAIPLMLNSLWALIPAAIAVIAIVVRTELEDRTLQNELDGYRDYANRVKYRLIPGLW